MNEHSDKLKDVLADNGAFDAHKAQQDILAASAHFDAQLQRNSRLIWLGMVILISFFECGFVGFMLAYSVKALIGFASLLLGSVFLISLYSLGYELRNTRLSLGKELRLLRLERVGRSADETGVFAEKAAPPNTSIWRILRPWENAAWLLAIVLTAAASNYLTFRFMDSGLTMNSESRTTIAADGSSVTVDKVSYLYRGFFSLTTLSLYSGAPSYNITQWLDGQGRELPISVETIGKNRKFTVHLVEPITAGNQVAYTTVSDNSSTATQQDGVWTYRGGVQWGGMGQKYLLQTIQLPAGAEIVSAEPKPAQQLVRDGLPSVRYQAVVDQNHALAYTIKYRLAQKAESPSPGQ